MPNPHAVVIPFGVPIGGRGLGLGLAALVHSCAHVEGGGIAIAQLHGRRNDDPVDALPSPVEAFVQPSAWRDIAGEARTGIGVVLTGAFEPPGDGDGTIQLLAFDARDGRTLARVEARLDEAAAGASLVGALEQLWSLLDGEIGALQGLRELAWEPLESVLRAERCALHDPRRGGPHDRLAAMLHLGRAIGDAPSARYPVERIAALGFETAMGSALDRKLASAAARALARAVDDAPHHVELVEALAALQLRLGQEREAERRLNAAIARDPQRSRLYALLSQALRARGHLDAALAALQSGFAACAGDPLLCAEQGMVLAVRGDMNGASAAWRHALACDSVHPAAFGSLAALALRMGDTIAAQSLVDAALSADRAHPDVLRGAVQLALATETDGIARASRVAGLSSRLLDAAPGDPLASLALARALIALGDASGARVRLAELARLATSSAAAAEAEMLILAIDNPNAELELRSVLRAARAAAPGDLADVATRARRLATRHGAWLGWLASAIAEGRRGRWASARGALDIALELAPGATAVHLEMASVLVALEDASGAVTHAERALMLEGDTTQALSVLARALAAARRPDEARQAAGRALATQPESLDLRALVVALGETNTAQPKWRVRWQGALRKWQRR
ncbi:MAG: tetratricopeptide repeat protein [Myxococcota bacterium]|nr:tetratricopeptide repeat protein [Myxococcota bacterium]